MTVPALFTEIGDSARQNEDRRKLAGKGTNTEAQLRGHPSSDASAATSSPNPRPRLP